MRSQCALVEGHTIRWAHERGHHFTPPIVGYADHGHLRHRRMRKEHVLDLAGVDVLAPADDHVLDPALDPEEPALVHRGEIARVVPAFVVDGLAGGLGHVVVPGHDQISPCAELADGADGDHVSLDGVADAHLGLRQWPAQRPGPIIGVVVGPYLGQER